jgi:hypothetical protein
MECSSSVCWGVIRSKVQCLIRLNMNVIYRDWWRTQNWQNRKHLNEWNFGCSMPYCLFGGRLMQFTVKLWVFNAMMPFSVVGWCSRWWCCRCQPEIWFWPRLSRRSNCLFLNQWRGILRHSVMVFRINCWCRSGGFGFYWIRSWKRESEPILWWACPMSSSEGPVFTAYSVGNSSRIFMDL